VCQAERVFLNYHNNMNHPENIFKEELQSISPGTDNNMQSFPTHFQELHTIRVIPRGRRGFDMVMISSEDSVH